MTQDKTYSKEYMQGWMDCAANTAAVQLLLGYMHQNAMTHENISRGTLALSNFNRDVYQYIKPARLVKFTQGICFDLTDKEKKTIGTILGIGDELFKPVQVYKSPKSSEPKL